MKHEINILVFDEETKEALDALPIAGKAVLLDLDGVGEVDFHDAPVELWIARKELGGNDSLRNFTQALFDEGFEVVVVVVEPPEPYARWADAAAALPPDQAVEHAVRTTLDPGQLRVLVRRSEDVDSAKRYLNSSHAVVRVGSKEVILSKTREYNGTESVQFQSVADFKLKYANWRIDDIPVADSWLKWLERQEYNGVTFAPGERHVTRGFYNLFSGWAVNPVQGDCSLFWRHLQEVICGGSEKLYLYLMLWLAHMVQRPHERPEVAPVLIGGQGGGKGSFVDAVGSLLGRHYLTVYRMAQITGRFNAHLRDAFLLHANEAIWDGARNCLGALKGLITDKTIPIEAKGVDIQNIDNCKRLIISSNSDFPVAIDMDDRRFCVMRVSDHMRGDREYFAAFHAQLDNGGREALLYDLLHMDLEGFDPRTAPRTKEAFEVKLRGASSVVLWWHECLVDGALLGAADQWRPQIGVQALFDGYVKWCEHQGLQKRSQQLMGRELTQMLDGTEFTRVRPGAGNRRPWTYLIPILEKARTAFQDFSKSGPEIWAK